jgi:inorganic pyrophosphatase
MLDGDVSDHKIIAVATQDPEFSGYHRVDEIPPHKVAIIRRFLQDYKQLERKTVRVDEIQAAESAWAVIAESLEAYKKSFREPAVSESKPA